MNRLSRKQAMPVSIKALLGLGALAVAGALFLAFYSNDPLRTVDAAPPWQADMDDLRQAVQNDRKTLQLLSQSLEGLRASVRDTAARVENRQIEQGALAQSFKSLRSQLVSTEHIALTNEQDLKTLQAQFVLLEQRLREPVAAKAKPATLDAPKNRAALSTGKPLQAPLSPPFRVLDLDYRGGEAFLMIAPQTGRSLGDIRLLREGDNLLGWQLASLSSQRAVFTVGHRKHTIELNPALGMN